MSRLRCLCPVLCGLCSAAFAQVTIRSIQPGRTEVPRFGKIELKVEATGDWTNPYDPDQIDIVAQFTTPSGKTLSVPAFWMEECALSTGQPEDRRRQVKFLKLYVSEREWGTGERPVFFLDDVTLLNSKTGATNLLDDMEASTPRRWWPEDTVGWSQEVAHGGKQSLRFAPTIDAEENWPGALFVAEGADWSAYDGLSLWLYPQTTALTGPVHLYFNDERFGNSPIPAWGAAQLKLNEWNHLTWRWEAFAPAVAFEPTGEKGWRVRFTPVEVGTYRCSVTAVAGSEVARSEETSFRVIRSKHPGFVRVSEDDPHYFVFDNGEPFFPIGHDVPWGLNDALVQFPKMRAHGENCTYFIMSPWDTSIEWKKFGEYDQVAAARLDGYVRCAEENGIRFKLSFDIHDALRKSRLWGENPYNAANGGPCREVNDFYTSPEAYAAYTKRLRYILARWGYSPNIMAWEGFAENDGPTQLPDGSEGWGYPTRAGGEQVSAMLVTWLRKVAAFLRANDPYGRLFTASFGGDVSDPDVWALPEVQYTQIHHYNSIDTAPPIHEWCAKLTREYAKPMMVTEFGWNTQAIDYAIDPQGICLHNGIWASALSGAAGGALNWWWDRVEALNLYPQCRALRSFAEGIDWPKEGFAPALCTVTPPAADHFVPVTIQSRGPFASPPLPAFTVARDGTVNDPEKVPSHLLAAGRSEGHQPAVFQVDYPQPGTFGVHVDCVSPDAALDILVDGQLAAHQDLPAENVPGKQCTFSEQWKVWQCRHDETYSAPIPAGQHEIRVLNSKPGPSWIRVASYTLTDYAPPTLRALGLTGKRLTLLWLQNAESTWGNDVLDRQPQTLTGATLAVNGLRDGTYTVQWWDTWKGKAQEQDTVRSHDGTLRLEVPPVTRDVACKVRRE